MHDKRKVLAAVCFLGIVLVLTFQNCGNIKLNQTNSASEIPCVEEYGIASVREASAVRFYVVQNADQHPTTIPYTWRVTFGDEVVQSGSGTEIVVPNSALTNCRRYKIEIDKEMSCNAPEFISTDYVHGENCNPVIIPDPPEPKDPPENPIEYGPNSCPVQPIPRDDGCFYKDANGNDQVPPNQDGMTVAANRQNTARFVYGPRGAGVFPLTDYHTVFNYLPQDTAVCGNNCGPVNEGFGFPSGWGTNTHVRQEIGKFISLKFRVPTGNRWHHVGSRIAAYSHLQTTGFAVSISRCPGQFREAPQAPLPSNCSKFVYEGGGQLYWEIAPPGGTANGAFSCALEPGQTYYMNFIKSGIEPTDNLGQTSICNMSNYDPPRWPGTCGSVIDIGGTLINFGETGSPAIGCTMGPPPSP